MEWQPHCCELAFVPIFSFLAFLNHHLIPFPRPLLTLSPFVDYFQRVKKSPGIQIAKVSKLAKIPTFNSGIKLGAVPLSD